MIQIITYIALGIIIGFSIAWFIHVILANKLNKSVNSLEGFLETEKLVRDRLQKENIWLIETKEVAQKENELKLAYQNKEHALQMVELKNVIRIMDEDILLMQKSNEETEALLQSTNPVVHALKLKLIEANNTIARFKAHVPVK
ncbi:MAG: hypothetical protein ABIT58_10600 [Ferruginibacter sp.]